jgi:hypothetical protein
VTRLWRSSEILKNRPQDSGRCGFVLCQLSNINL